MPDEIERVADKLWARIEKSLEGCTTAACQRARAEAEEVYKKTVKDGDMESLKELKSLREDIGKMVEIMAKGAEAPVVEECPSCSWDRLDQKPKTVGKCENGCTRINEHEKKLGFKHCPMCGGDILYYEED